MRPLAPINQACPLYDWFQQPGHTLTKLAGEAELSVPAIFRFIRGQQGLGYGGLLKVAEASGVAVEQLVTWADVNEARRKKERESARGRRKSGGGR